MRKIFLKKGMITLISIVFMLSLLSSAQIASEFNKAVDYQLEYTVSFSQEYIIFGTLMGYDLIQLSDGTYINDVGKPMMPVKQLNIALPDGMKADDISVVGYTSELIQGEYNIFPAQPPQKTNVNPDEINYIAPNKDIYSSHNPYPSETVLLLGQSDLAGQSWVTVQINPLKYYPSEKKLEIITSLTFKITGTNGYICGDYLTPSISQKNKEDLKNEIKELVINPEDVTLKGISNPQMPLSLPPGGPYDYVIIGSSSDSNYWQPLIDWRTKTGMKATFVTTTYIYANYVGSNNQQKIRNFVIDARNNWGTMYFLIAGENGYVPFEYRTYYQESTPSDEYYSDYDDDWTNEVYVGRVTAQGATQIDTFIDKLIAYESNPQLSNYLLDVLLVGMDADSSTPMEELKEMIDNYIPGQFTVTKVYDSYGGNHKTAVINALNDGQQLVNHADHGDWDFMGTGYYWHGLGLINSNIDALYNNNKPSIVVSLACHPNEMDHSSDCIAEHFVIYNPNQGGVAFTGNTRYGWYYIGQTLGLTNTLDYEWWRGLFSRHYIELGHILVDAKHHFSTSSPDADVKQHCEWEFSLLGDPAMPIWTNAPEDLVVTHPNELSIGSSPYLVHVEDDSGVDINNAYVCLWKDGEIYVTGYTNSAGDVTLYPAPTSTGTMYVTVTKHDYNNNFIPYQGQATVIEEFDEEPPTPNPMTWNIPPVASSPTDIVMQATTASDDSPPVYYYFHFVSGGSGGTDSTWQTDITYVDSGLQPNTQYTYQVKARDSFDPPNEGSYSTSGSAYTLANVPGAPAVNNPTGSTIDVNIDPGNNPATTEFAIMCDSTSPPDSTWNGKYVDASGNPSTSGVWQTDSTWGTITVNNLNQNTFYSFSVKARNHDLIETDFGDSGSGYTILVDFTVQGYCTYEDMSPVDTLIVDITNLDTEETYVPDIVGNSYNLVLDAQTEVSIGDTLRIIAKDGVNWIKVDDYQVTTTDWDAGGINQDLILDEFYLDLTDFPMYQALGPDYDMMCGPAVAQMALNYMYWNKTTDPSGPPMEFSDQTALYNEGKSLNSNPGLDYFDIQGMYQILQNNRPGDYSEYGYNFVKQANTDIDHMLEQICLWVNYDVIEDGVGQHPDHPHHVPSIIPAYGDYTNWMAIRGIHTNQDAYPLPPDLTVYGFWVNDPYLGGLGENSYKTITQFTSSYYFTLSTGDDWDGEYVAVLEPPIDQPECELTFAQPTPRFTPVQSDILKMISDLSHTPHYLQILANNIVIKAAIQGLKEELIPYDSNFKEVFENAIPGVPIKIKSFNDYDYYLVPFVITGDEDTVIVAIVDAEDGSFKEASWSGEPMKYLPLSKMGAKQIIIDFLNQIDDADQELQSLNPELIHRDNSPYYPEWYVKIPGYEIFVDQEGNLDYIIIK